jgi:hypothetical protein
MQGDSTTRAVYSDVQECTDLYRSVQPVGHCVVYPMANTGESKGFRLDLGEPLATQLADFCKEKFRGKTQVVREALTEYFERQRQQADTAERKGRAR